MLGSRGNPAAASKKKRPTNALLRSDTVYDAQSRADINRQLQLFYSTPQNAVVIERCYMDTPLGGAAWCGTGPLPGADERATGGVGAEA